MRWGRLMARGGYAQGFGLRPRIPAVASPEGAWSAVASSGQLAAHSAGVGTRQRHVAARFEGHTMHHWQQAMSSLAKETEAPVWSAEAPDSRGEEGQVLGEKGGCFLHYPLAVLGELQPQVVRGAMAERDEEENRTEE